DRSWSRRVFAVMSQLRRLLSRRWCDNLGTTNGRRLSAARCNERFLHCIDNTRCCRGCFDLNATSCVELKFPAKSIHHRKHLDLDQLLRLAELEHRHIGRCRLVVEWREIRVDASARLSDVAHQRP